MPRMVLTFRGLAEDLDAFAVALDDAKGPYLAVSQRGARFELVSATGPDDRQVWLEPSEVDAIRALADVHSVDLVETP